MNILTVKFGDKYPSSYVNDIYDWVQINERTLTTSRFEKPWVEVYCYTDDPTGLNPDINIIPIEDGLEGVWHKLAMFQKDFGGIKGKIMYMDLDVVVQRDISGLYYIHNEFTMVKCYWKPIEELYKEDPKYSRFADDYHIKTDMNINSSVMIWNQNENVHIWEHFLQDPEYHMHKYLGIDRFLYWEELTNNFFSEGTIYSRNFGIDAINGWYKPWSQPYFKENGFICLLNGNTTEKDRLELLNDINNYRERTLSI
ncbi:MAG: hypothetical protein CMD98_04645 [Gammaproteobacteria bacterium]|nr:hypothetical protein [Gammaproteobacteria bacterium]